MAVVLILALMLVVPTIAPVAGRIPGVVQATLEDIARYYLDQQRETLPTLIVGPTAPASEGVMQQGLPGLTN